MYYLFLYSAKSAFSTPLLAEYSYDSKRASRVMAFCINSLLYSFYLIPKVVISTKKTFFRLAILACTALLFIFNF